MSLLYGFNAYITAGKEDPAQPYGTAQTATTEDIRINSATLQTSQERSRKANLSVPTSGMLASDYDGFRVAGGTVDMPIHYDGVGQFFDAALGASNTTGTAPVYTHTYTPDFALPALTLQFQRGSNLNNSKETFTGMKVSAMRVSCEAGGELTASFDFIGKDGGTRSSNTTAVLPTHDAVLHFEAGQLIVGGSLTFGNLDIRSFELTLDNKLDRRNNLGSKITGEPVITDVREVTMSVTCDVTDNNAYADSLSGVSGEVSILFTRTADANHGIKFILSDAKIEDYNDNVTAFGRVERTFTVRGFASGANTGLTILVYNANTSALY